MNFPIHLHRVFYHLCRARQRPAQGLFGPVQEDADALCRAETPLHRGKCKGQSPAQVAFVPMQGQSEALHRGC